MQEKDRIVIGCNYHTTWQSNPEMRFVLDGISEDGTRVRLRTRRTKKVFWTDTKDLIFIKTKYNKNKAKELKKNLWVKIK